MRGIISGGQTGVDRAALDVALELGLACGGWCPLGRAADDGRIAPHYALRETTSDAPEQRTVWNVFDSDATLIVAPAPLAGGTLLALETAARFDRPRLVVEPSGGAVTHVTAWLDRLPPDPLLNIAGPRESEWPGIYLWTRELLRILLLGRPNREIESRRVLVTGGAGYLGSHLIRLAPPGLELHATERSTPAVGCQSHPVELSDAEAVARLLATLRPAAVIHTAYGTAAGDRDIVIASRNIAEAAARVGARLIHVSSDMVLDGSRAPFAEDAEPDPVHEYGRWKAAAERDVRRLHPHAAIVRSSLITSFDPPDARTDWVLSGLRGEVSVALFVDELRSPILAGDLARQIWEIVRLDEPEAAGVWHLAAAESLSRYTLGLLIAAAHGFDPAPLRPARSAEADEPRPRDLRLLTSRAERQLPTRPRLLSAAAAECREHVSMRPSNQLLHDR